jgi:hypothetical protein
MPAKSAGMTPRRRFDLIEIRSSWSKSANTFRVASHGIAPDGDLPRTFGHSDRPQA